MSKFSCFLFFGNPTNKTVTRTAYVWGLLIAKTTWTNHYDRPIRNTEPQSGPIDYTLLGRCTNCVAPFTSNGKLHEFGVENQFPELSQHILTFSQ